MPPRIRNELPAIRTFSRQEFLAERWNCRAGQHVTVLGPTGCGKTTLLLQLAAVTARPNYRAVVLATKPRDDTMKRLSASQKWPVIKTYPPPWTIDDTVRYLFGDRPSGYVLWPKHTYDPEADDAYHARVFRSAYISVYKKGHGFVVSDEADTVDVLRTNTGRSGLPVATAHALLLKKGRSMGAGSWQASQRPFNLIQEAYSQAQYIFMHADPDRRNVDRYREISGISGEAAHELTQRLPYHHFLYIDVPGRHMCVVAP